MSTQTRFPLHSQLYEWKKLGLDTKDQLSLNFFPIGQKFDGTMDIWSTPTALTWEWWLQSSLPTDI